MLSRLTLAHQKHSNVASILPSRKGLTGVGADADDEVAIEATGNSAWFRDQILPCVGRVVVVNPSQFKVIRKSVKKTDRNDAAALALFLAKDMLCPRQG